MNLCIRQCLLSFGAVVVLAGNAWAADPANGKTVYQQNCQACHQAAGAGVPGAFPPLANNPNIAGNPQYLAEAIIKGVSGPLEVNGKQYNGAMPPMGHIDNQKIVDLVAYILSDLNGGDGAISEASVQALR
ncbi:c-type cytochrome [Marinimicrobium locisalis]|uniref:c-type cytochrome n=1 Tax=Marinimicrobium locisalis TaxID=546022 RepID=UPI0032218E40